MKKKLLVGLTVGLFLVAGDVYATSLTNFGFETGDFNGWDVGGGTPLVVDSYVGAGGTYSAVGGTYFALLGSGSSSITQDFIIDAGDSIYGNAAFDANGPYWSKNNDGASVQILNESGTSIAMTWYMDNARTYPKNA